MYEKLFKRPHALTRHRTGPLAEERHRYLIHCADQQMSSERLRRIALYTLIVAKALHLADRPDECIATTEIEAAALRWANRQPKPATMRKPRNSWREFVGQASRWLKFLGRLQPMATARSPFAQHVTQFTDYMLRERGLSPHTVSGRCRTINEFLRRIDNARLQLDSLSVANVDELLLRKIQEAGYARITVRKYASSLRAFFRYAEGRGWCRVGLAAAIMAPRVFSYEPLPIGVPWADVKRLLTAAKGDRIADVRDHAILLILAIYGLRAGEVASLKLNDFDWEQEVLTVPHNKRQKPRTYPLCRSVGDAVLRYLREARPRSAGRELFLTLRAPFRPLPSAALGWVVGRRLRALNVTLRHYGPHAHTHCGTPAPLIC